MQQGFSTFTFPISDLKKQFKLKAISGTSIAYSNEAEALSLNRPYLKTYGMPLEMAKRVYDKEYELEINQPFKTLTRSGRGRAIPYSTMKKMLQNTYKVLMPDNTNIENVVLYELAVSMLYAEGQFDDNASNCFIKKVNSLSEEQYEDVQRFAFGKVVLDRDGNIIQDTTSEEDALMREKTEKE